MRRAILVCFLLLLPAGFSKELAGHTLVVSIDRAGNAQISEKYTMQLNYSEYEEFERIAKSTTTDIGMWRAFFDQISATAIGNISSLTTSASTAGAGNFGNNVVLTYSINGFADKTAKVGRDIIFEIDGPKFSFYQPLIGKFILPWKTELQIKFAQSIRKTDMIEATPSPSQASIVDDQYTLFWYGSRIDSAFLVKYKVEEGIGELNLTTIVNSTYWFFYENPVYAIAAAIVLVLLVAYRRPIIGLIGESFGGEEEIELPKRGV